ncbi:MAG: helix-turn-helix domain-containing protein, partial [Acidimicrobiia bacterium]|nr:helix-turn-helix domain-containing protein [Acidimicrobiia bacterium]
MLGPEPTGGVVPPGADDRGTITLGASAADLRRQTGPVAWCALEVLAAHAAVESDRVIAYLSVRELATALGIAPNTAHRAAGRLVRLGLARPVEQRRA